MRSVEVNAFGAAVPGATLVGEWAGDGPAVVLLHAGICDRRMWDAEFAALAEDYRVIRYDSRGVGDSARDRAAGDVPFTYHADLLAVLDKLGIHSATVVGCSFGGRIALDTALAAPDRVAALVLVSARPGGVPFDPVTEAAVAEIEATIERGDIDAANELEMRLWVDGPGRSPGAADPEVRSFVAEMNRALLSSDWDGQGWQPLDPPAVDRLGEVTVPTLVAVGEHDIPGVITAAHVFAERIPHSHFVRFPDAAHLPNLERPAEFVATLRTFLGHHSHHPMTTAT
jgi:pimeloyl-ACP methyl ester carboxylesterase